MDEKQSILISLGASVACNCIPCFEHYYMMALQKKIEMEKIDEVVAIADKVKSGAAIVMKKAVDSVKKGEIPQEELGKDAPCGCSCN